MNPNFKNDSILTLVHNAKESLQQTQEALKILQGLIVPRKGCLDAASDGMALIDTSISVTSHCLNIIAEFIPEHDLKGFDIRMIETDGENNGLEYEVLLDGSPIAIVDSYAEALTITMEGVSYE